MSSVATLRVGGEGGRENYQTKFLLEKLRDIWPYVNNNKWEKAKRVHFGFFPAFILFIHFYFYFVIILFLVYFHFLFWVIHFYFVIVLFLTCLFFTSSFWFIFILSVPHLYFFTSSFGFFIGYFNIILLNFILWKVILGNAVEITQSSWEAWLKVRILSPLAFSGDRDGEARRLSGKCVTLYCDVSP